MRGVKFLVLLACAATLAGCGLPDQYYLQPPISRGLAGGTGNSFTFSNPDHLTGDSNITFKGYELYYKFYPDATNIDINAYDPNNTADVVSQLTSKGFLPVASDQDFYPVRNVPVIPILPADIAASFTVQVNINTMVVTESNFLFSPLITSQPGNLRRDVQDTFPGSNFGHFKTYYYNTLANPNNYQSSDADCGLIGGLVGGTGQTACLVMYALSYGLQGISTPQRSIPIYLGYLTLQIN